MAENLGQGNGILWWSRPGTSNYLPKRHVGIEENGLLQKVERKNSEPVFLNVYGAQEYIPRNEFRQPM
jgi:hypothetical protein